MTEPLAETLKRLRKKKRITQQAVADHIGVSVQAVSKWENGGWIAPDNLVKLAALLDFESLLGAIGQPATTVTWLAWDLQTVKGVVPTISGQSLEATDFALAINNNIMAPEFQEGELILVRSLQPNTPPTSLANRFLIVQKPGSVAFLRQWVVEGGSVFLRPLNEQYPVRALEKGERAVGVVVAKLKLYEDPSPRLDSAVLDPPFSSFQD